ncbi:MAG: radical SAM protein [Chloroflexi bacterium]|nr:radical SAM protein [Chloroflexota bacterium]
MRILLVSGNKPGERLPVFPLGLAYLAGSLNKMGHEIIGFDVAFHRDYKEPLKKAIAEFCPEAIGISLRNLDNQRYSSPISFLPEARAVVKVCQESSKAKIIVGGSGFSIAPEQLLNYLGADLGIVGEGERAISDLAQAIEERSDCGNIPRVVVRGHGRTKMAKPRRIEDPGSLELPNRDIFEPRKYLQAGVVLNVRTKRGCPFKCIYCTTPQIEGSKMRVITLQKVVNELEILKEVYGTDEFYFTDNIFNYPAKHAESICEEIISRRLNIKWYCIANPCSLSKDLLRLMKEAGCYGLSLGNESGSPQMLRNLRKNFTVEQVSQSCSYCRELGINYTCFLLLGGPGENRGTVEESISTMERLKPDSLSITIGIRVYPNTELARIAKDEGILDVHSDLLSPTFYLSHKIRDWIFDYIKEVGERNGWNFPILAETDAS